MSMSCPFSSIWNSSGLLSAEEFALLFFLVCFFFFFFRLPLCLSGEESEQLELLDELLLLELEEYDDEGEGDFFLFLFLSLTFSFKKLLSFPFDSVFSPSTSISFSCSTLLIILIFLDMFTSLLFTFIESVFSAMFVVPMKVKRGLSRRSAAFCEH